MHYVPPHTMQPPSLAAPLQKISAQILVGFGWPDNYISSPTLLFLSLLLSFTFPSFLSSCLPSFLSFLPFHLFCFHPSHDYKYAFLWLILLLLLIPLVLSIKKKKKGGFVALSEKEEERWKRKESFHSDWNLGNLVSFPQHPHDSLYKDWLL